MVKGTFGKGTARSKETRKNKVTLKNHVFTLKPALAQVSINPFLRQPAEEENLRLWKRFSTRLLILPLELENTTASG